MPTWLAVLLAISGSAYFSFNTWLMLGYLQANPKVGRASRFICAFTLFCFGVPIMLGITAVAALWPPKIDARMKRRRSDPMKLPPNWKPPDPDVIKERRIRAVR